MMRAFWQGTCLAAGLVAAPMSPALAHPHAWIDFDVELRFDGEERITAMRQVWLFDEFYTAFALQEIERDADGGPSARGLEALAQGNLERLEEYGYFTRLYAGTDAIAIDSVSDVETRVEGDRLLMAFTAEFAEGAPADRAFEYAIYDPTYWIEMLHTDGEASIRLAGAPAGCEIELVDPTPSGEMVTLAAMLDVYETDSDGLGSAFAERVTIRCE